MKTIYDTPYNECISGTDVWEEIAVYPDYIQYNTWCGPCRIDYSKFRYKVNGKKLLVKAFEFGLVEFGKNYQETKPFFFLKDGKLNNKIIDEYINWMVENGKRIHEELKEKYKDDSRFQGEYTQEDEDERIKIAIERSRWYVKKIMKWHEFKYVNYTCYSRKARNYIIKKIENKDFD